METPTPTMGYNTLDIRYGFLQQKIGSKTIKNVQIDKQTKEIWPTELNIPLSVT